MVSKLDYGIRGNFSPFLPANGLVLDGTNVSGNLFDLQVGGASRFTVTKSGSVTFNYGQNISFPTAQSVSVSAIANGYIKLLAEATDGYSIAVLSAPLGGPMLSLPAGSGLGICSTFTSTGTVDTILRRDAAGIFAQRNGVNAQAFRIYNTYTDASNYERGIFDWQSNTNVLTIGTQNAGTGSARDLRIIANNNTVAYFSSNGLVTVNNSILIGNSTISTTITPTTASLINLSPLLLMGS